MKPVRVVVVEDQLLVRRGIIELLEPEDEIEVVGEARDGVEALETLSQTNPEVALVDARMPKMDGVELLERLVEEHPEISAIILTTFDDDEYVFGGLRAGARGYLLKDTPPEELVAAIHKVRRGEMVLGGQIVSRVVSELQRSPTAETRVDKVDGLSKREAEVVKLVGLGATNEEIAQQLYISEGTAKNHIWRILRKLGFRDRVELALYAVEKERTERT